MSEPAADRVYGLHGLLVRSPLPLAGFSASEVEWDVDIVWGSRAPVPASQPPGRIVAARVVEGRYWYVAADSGEHTILRIPAVCDFAIERGGRVVECRPDPAADDRFVAVLISGLVLAFVLGLQGDCALHASAVEYQGVAIAIAGQSGMGKTTLAATLCAAGAKLVADDVLRVVTGRGPVMCVRGGPQLRLRASAASVIQLFPTPPATSVTVDGRLVVEPPSADVGSIPLAAIVLALPSRDQVDVDLVPVRGAGALIRLAAVPRVIGWKDPPILRRQFELLTAVATAVPVVEARLPWRVPPAPNLASALLALAHQER